MAKKQTNWDRIRNQDAMDTLTNRDVHGDQQFERSKLGEKQTMTSRLVADVALTVLAFFVAYFVIGICKGIAAYLYGYADGMGRSFSYYVGHFTFGRLCLSLLIAVLFFAIMYVILKRNLDSQNSMNETADINQYANDQHVALPEEVQRKFDWFPDVGATSNVQFSSMISHCALNNKGLNPVMVARRVPEDIVDEDGDVLLYKGEILRDDNGEVLYEQKPMIDIDFMKALYKASGVPYHKDLWKFYDATKIEYNPGNKDRDKQKGYETVADLINGDWQLPAYEPQRPAGAYLVDTAPVNTMV